MHIDLSWLKSFLSLARTRNFAAAASQNNVTQPAFSRRIRALEAWIGADLIDRSTYPTTLTPAGERFLRVADDIDRQLAEVRAEMKEIAAADRPKVVVAAQHGLALTLVPDLLRRVQAEQGPLLSVVHADNVHDCAERLLAGNADLLIAYAPAETPLRLDGAEIRSQPLGADRLVPAVVPDAGGRPAYALDAPGGEPVPWLSYGDGTMLEHTVADLLDRRGGNLTPVVRNPITEVLRRFALAGLGVAWLPEALIAQDLRRGALVHAGAADWAVDLPIRAYSPCRPSNPAVERVWADLAA